MLTVQNCAYCQSGKHEIQVCIFLGLICYASDTSYTTKKLGHTAEKTQKISVYYRAERMRTK
jgi:hypothetical protein